MLYKPARKVGVPCQMVGRHWRFRKQAIVRWLGHDGTVGVKTR